MAEIIWIDQAISDLNNIAEFITQESEKYASLTVNRIFERTEILEKFPLSGRVVPEMNQEEIRELIEGNYRIIYEVVSKDRVEILTVHHSARQLNNL